MFEQLEFKDSEKQETEFWHDKGTETEILNALSFLSRYQPSAELILFEKRVYNSCEGVFGITFLSKFFK